MMRNGRRHVSDGCAFFEKRIGHRLARAINNVDGVVCFGSCDESFEPVVFESNAGVSKRQPFMTRLSSTEIAASSRQRWPGANESHRRALANVLFDNLRRGVSRAAVSDHDLVGRTRLCQQAIQQLANGLLLIPDRNDDTNLHKPQDLATKRHKSHKKKT